MRNFLLNDFLENIETIIESTIMEPMQGKIKKDCNKRGEIGKEAFDGRLVGDQVIVSLPFSKQILINIKR